MTMLKPIPVPLPHMRHPATGVCMTVHDLPAAIVRWTPTRRLMIVQAITNKLISRAEVHKRYNTSEAELADWFKQFSVESPVLAAEQSNETLDIYRNADLTIDFKNRVASVGSSQVTLTSAEWRIVQALAAVAPNPVHKRALYRMFYTDDRVQSKIFDVFVCRLRRKLGAQFLLTIWGRGFAMLPNQHQPKEQVS